MAESPPPPQDEQQSAERKGSGFWGGLLRKATVTNKKPNKYVGFPRVLFRVRRQLTAVGTRSEMYLLDE